MLPFQAMRYGKIAPNYRTTTRIAFVCQYMIPSNLKDDLEWTIARHEMKWHGHHRSPHAKVIGADCRSYCRTVLLLGDDIE